MRKEEKGKRELEHGDGEVDHGTRKSTDSQSQDDTGRGEQPEGQLIRGAGLPRRRLGEALKDIGDRIKTLTPTAPSS